MPLGEQTIINKKIRGLDRIGKIPIDYVIWGLNIYNTNMAIIHHAVCTKGIPDKIAQMKKVNDYLEWKGKKSNKKKSKGKKSNRKIKKTAINR